jgi:hypothetical protein
MIAQRNLSLLGNRLVKEGGQRMRDDVLERDYCLAWLLSFIGESEIGAALAFKGGTALKRCYFGDYRFSEDLDFSLVREMSLEEIKGHLEGIYKKVYEASGIQFSFNHEEAKHTNSYTFYLQYVGPMSTANTVKVDITIREEMAFNLEQRPILKAYDEFHDLPENRFIATYSLDEIASEKIMALADPARNEPRDLYDLWQLTSEKGVSLDHLADPICRKLQFRKKSCEGITDRILGKEARLGKLWVRRLNYQMASLPHYATVFRSVKRSLRQASLP